MNINIKTTNKLKIKGTKTMKTTILSIFAFSILTFAGCKQEEPKKDTTQSGAATTTQTEVKADKPDSSIIRAKDVDVASIDKNKDGKVFQCPMDANVISDKQEPCPLCKMDLDEVTIEVAKEHLK
ncbi:MAG: heavy metal-binding domain-containing protein [Ignavibacteriaceae bacterium]|nr:heavy metal-binding domain-containing protein [Ignavibacteriaceae bacterium]